MATIRYMLHLAYRGTNYSGWQIQPNANSVQETLTAALQQLLQQEIAIVGCGRTDAGVHARSYYIHFDYEGDFPPNLVYRLNRILPADIAIYELCDTIPQDTHARYSACSRAYQYHIHFAKDPFLQGLSYYYPQKLPDLELMRKAAALLPQYNNFPMFCKTDSDAQHYLCDVRRAEWKEEIGHKSIVFEIEANRFLRGMVRLIVGSLLMVGEKKISLDEYEATLAQVLPKFKTYNLSVPPEGLYLSRVVYPFQVNQSSIL